MTLLVKQPYFFHVHKQVKRYKLGKQQSGSAKDYNPFTGFSFFFFNAVFNSVQQLLLKFANIFVSYKFREARAIAGNNRFDDFFSFSAVKPFLGKVFLKCRLFRIGEAHNYNIVGGIIAKISQKRNLVILLIVLHCNANAAPCVGKFVNPVTDICWSCIFPISIGSINIYSGGREDTKNPDNPICMCGAPPRIGISIGFWEPVRLVDVTRTPYCMVSLGGFSFGEHTKKHGGVAEKTSGEALKHSFYHVHWYMYPVVYWLELLTDFLCLEEGSLDLAYLSELDPNWNNDELNAIIHPEAILFGNKIAQAACSIDCLQANSGFPSDSMYWCAGCQGGLYPFTGFIENHVGGVESSTLEVEKTIARLHRFGLAWETSGKGALCHKQVSPAY